MTIPIDADRDQKTFAHTALSIASGASAVIDTRGMSAVTGVTGAASSATISRVDSATAGANSADTAANQNVSSGTRSVLTVDWPFFRITASGGSVWVGLG